MKTACILAFASLFAGLVAAAPLEKREYAYVTVTSEVIEVVDVTVTVTLGGTTAPSATSAQYSWSWDHGTTTTTSTTSSSSSTTTSELPAETANAVVPEDTSVEPAAPTEAPESYAPAAVEEPVVEQPVVEQPASTEQAYVPPTTTAAPEPATTTTTQAPEPAQETQEPQYGATSTGGEYSGELTFYDAGLGACGWTNDGSVEDVVALPHGFMGAQSNGNPYCGKMIEVHYNGKTVPVKVVDKCMGCEGMSIDVSRSAFGKLADYDKGRITEGCTWNFVD